MSVEARLHATLPRRTTRGSNRFDTWYRSVGRWSWRVYVGDLTNGHASWCASLSRGEFDVSVRLTGTRIGRGTYVGPEPSTRESCDVEANWAFPRRSYWRGRDEHGWWRFGFGHLGFTLRSPRNWSVMYDSRHVNLYARLRSPR